MRIKRIKLTTGMSDAQALRLATKRTVKWTGRRFRKGQRVFVVSAGSGVVVKTERVGRGQRVYIRFGSSGSRSIVGSRYSMRASDRCLRPWSSLRSTKGGR